jgi:hypothetical protein
MTTASRAPSHSILQNTYRRLQALRTNQSRTFRGGEGRLPTQLVVVVLTFDEVTSPSDSALPISAANAAEVITAVDAMVDEYRTRCLWSLPPDYYPRTTSERLRILNAIEKNGDLAAHHRASTLRQWLSRLSSEASSTE